LGAQEARDFLGQLPVLGVVVRILVPLHAVDGNAGRQSLPVLDVFQGKEEAGCADKGIHAIGVGAPGAIGALLEQAPRIRPCGVTVVLALKRRFAKCGLNAKDPGIGGQGQLFRRRHNGGGVPESVVGNGTARRERSVRAVCLLAQQCP
jgi:hypothetical protein